MLRTFSSFALVAWACLGFASGGAGEAFAQAHTSCRQDPVAEASVPLDPAAAALLRGNQALRQGRAAEALEAYEESARLARVSQANAASLLAEANAARAALETEPPEAVEARLDLLEAALPALPTAIDGGLRLRLTLHVARSWQRLASKRAGAPAARDRKRADHLLGVAETAAAEANDERLLSYALGYRGGIYLEAERLDEARTLTRRALLHADRVAAHDAIYRWHAQLSRIERRADRASAALAAARRAVNALALARTDPARVLDSTSVRFDEEIEPIYLELVDLILEHSKTQPRAAQQALLAEARNTLEGLKAEEVRDYFEDPCLAAQRKVAPDAVPGAAVLYPVLLADRLELILGREGVLSQFTVQIGREELDRRTRELRRALPDRTSRIYLRSAMRLYDVLIRPIEKELSSADVLVVVPSGRLRQIPFAALYDEKKREHLIEKIAVASTPGLTLTDPRPLPASISQALAAGISDAVQGYPALENVREEIENVGETFPSVVLLNADFTADRFEDAIKTRPVGVVHIASHGEFRPDSSDSFILTYDGTLPMNRLARVIGRTRLRADEPLELLVLSACETAAGDDRSALGLAGVALQSGARSAIATLWSVSDQAAGRLVSRFYAEIGNGQSRAAALRIAQLSLLSDPAFKHPTYWSPFLLISSWL